LTITSNRGILLVYVREGYFNLNEDG